MTDAPANNDDALKKMNKLFETMERTSAEVCREARFNTALATANLDMHPDLYRHPLEDDDNDNHDVSNICTSLLWTTTH